MGSPLMSMITNVQKPERQGFLQRRPTLPHIDEACSQGTSEDSEKGRKNVSLEFEQAVCGCRTSVLLHVDAYVGGWVSVGFMKKVTKPTLAHLTIIPSILKVEGNHAPWRLHDAPVAAYCQRVVSDTRTVSLISIFGDLLWVVHVTGEQRKSFFWTFSEISSFFISSVTLGRFPGGLGGLLTNGLS